MTIKLITDGGADLPKEHFKEYDVSIVPLNLHFQGKDYKPGVDLDEESFYLMMRGVKELPKTSSPSPYDFYHQYKQVEEGNPILVVSLSSGLSSTYESAVIASKMYLEEHPNAQIEVIDTKTASVGTGMLVVQAARMIRNGTAFEEIVNAIRNKVKETKTFFYLESLENLIKGGRLDRVKGTIASVLNIKLLMRGDSEGKIDVVEKVRGTQNAIKRLIEQIGEYSKDFEKKILAISHSNCEEKAKKIIQQIMERYPFAEVLLTAMGPTMGTYAGEGGIVLAYE